MKTSSIILYLILGLLLLAIISAGTYFALTKVNPNQQNVNFSEDEDDLVNIPPLKNSNAMVINQNKNSSQVKNTNISSETNTNKNVNLNQNTNSSTNTNTSEHSYYGDKALTGTGGWKKFSNDTYRFSLKYPEGWQLSFTETVPELNYYEVSILPPNSQTGFTLARLATGFEGMTTIDQGQVTVGEALATREVLQDLEDPDNLNILVTFNDQDVERYQALFIVYSINDPDKAEIYEKIVGTIKFF